jgi:hypothetical protein
LAVPGAAAREEADARAAGEFEFGPDDRVDARSLRGLDQLDGSVEAVAIAEAEGGDPEPGCGLDHAFRRGGPFQEGVVGTGGEFSEPGHRHGVVA